MTDAPDTPPLQPPQVAPAQPVPIAPMPSQQSGMATGALVTGITSLIPVIGVIPGCVAVILSALVLYRKRPGRRMAVSGLTLGILGILLNCLIVGAAVYVARSSSIPLAKRTVCMTQLKTLSTATMLYIEDHDGQLPPNLAALNVYIGGPIMICPARKNPQPGRLDYVYVPPATRIGRVESGGNTILMCDLKGNHDDGRNVAFVDGHVSWMTEDRFQVLLARPHNTTFAEGLKKIEGP